MGMYDDLYCRYPLPHQVVQGEVFQTKSLDCHLDTYEVSTDGRLYQTHNMWTGKLAKPIPIHMQDGDSIRIYLGIVERPTFRSGWYEYVLTFRDGHVDTVECLYDGDGPVRDRR